MRSILRDLRRLRERVPRGRGRPIVRPRLESLEDRLVPSADFVQTNLVSNLAGMAATTDPNLINPWGLVAGPNGPFWVANNGTGTSTLYNGQGVPFPPGNPLIVNVPGGSSANGSPTGIVFNTSGSGFDVSQGLSSGSSVFLFDNLDGTISGWNPSVNDGNAIVAVKQSGAVFTGLAIGNTPGPNGQTLLYAADTKNGVIDVYDQNFHQVTTLAGKFTDPNLPAGFKPFNIQNIDGELYVEYSSANSGIVDVYNTDGTLDKNVGQDGRLITGGPLDKPWGVAVAPSSFGAFGNDLLVGNF
ncbi:MAG: TIGR03118 family protein, partial [Gemmataceae bacterium]